MFSLIVVYTLSFLFIYFTEIDITPRAALSVNLAKSVFLLIIYLVTVVNLYRKLKILPQSIMEKEVKSIYRQFIAFFIGFLVQVIYMSYIISYPQASFALEVCKTLIILVTFLAPIYWIIYAHCLTFKGMKEH